MVKPAVPHGMEMVKPRRPQSPPPAAAAAAAAAMCLVLGDDDLLREILLRLGLPASLLRASLVCRRWYRRASDQAFLRRFRDRHPPLVLGVYLNLSGIPRPRFFPVRPLPELATAAARRAGSFFDAAFPGPSAVVRDSRGGRLLVRASEKNYYGYVDSTDLVCSPLSPAGDTVGVPPPPLPVKLTHRGDEPVTYRYGEFLPVNGNGGEDDGRSYSYTCVLIGCSERQTTVLLYELQQDMRWVVRASASVELPPPRHTKVTLLDDSKFYILSATNKILVCDFPSSSISAMDLPTGVEMENDDTCRSIKLSRGDGSGLFLIHVKGPLLRVFHCRLGLDGGNSGSSWSLTDTICLRKVCADLGISASWTSVLQGHEHDAGVKIHSAGDSARFVFLEMFRAVIFLDIASRKAEKVYETRPEDTELFSVHPLTMIWPSPVFPLLEDG